MSANATFSEPWTGTLTNLEWPPTPRLVLLTLINFPILSIILNVLWQLVSRLPNCSTGHSANNASRYPAPSRNRPWSGTGYPSSALQQPTVVTQSVSSATAGKRCVRNSLPSRTLSQRGICSTAIASPSSSLASASPSPSVPVATTTSSVASTPNSRRRMSTRYVYLRYQLSRAWLTSPTGLDHARLRQGCCV